MPSVIQRALFWRVYLTLLGSLVLVAVLSAVVWHLAGPPMRPPMDYPGAALGALLPPTGAPAQQQDQALEKLSAAIKGRVLLLAPGGHPLAAAAQGHMSPTPEAAAFLWRERHRPTIHLWRARLPDGRRLVFEETLPRPDGGPHVLVMLIIVAASVGVAAYPLVSRLTRRLETLRTSLDAWGAGRLQTRAAVDGNDEVAAVATSFNAAADRIEALLAAHKALLAHASHELRSPLTRLRMAVELFTAQPTAELRASILADIEELNGLVDEILLASRLDHAPELPERETVDLLALAAEEAARGGAGLSASAPASAYQVQGSPRLLRRMIRNLIDNAVKHGRAPVEVDLAREGAHISLAVHDHGEGIPEAERERVFEPFYRPSGRSEAAGSWGLGLSIVRQIVERHGGSVACRRRDGGGGSFVVSLPAANGSAAADA